MAGQIALAGSRPINQLQSLQTRDDLSGLDVEDSLEAQNLNRRQQIANLLMQQGLQPIHGQQAGRFYVPPSWTQGLAQLASAGLGAALTNNVGQEQADLGRQAQEQRAQAVQDYIHKTSPQAVTTELEGPGAPAQKDLLASHDFVSQLSPGEIAQGRWQQEVDTQGPGAFQEGQRPTTTTMQAPSENAKRQELIKLLTSRDPSIRRFGELQFQQQAHEREQAAQREQQTAEKALDRDVRREGILANADMRAAQIEGNIAITKMNIANNERAGQDASELRKDLARMTADLQNTLHDKDNATRLKIAEIGAEAKAAGADKKKTDQEVKAEAGRHTVSSLVTTLGDAYDQLDAAGGITNPEKGPMENLTAGAQSSGVGQTMGKFFGTQNQSLRNQILQQRPLLLNAIKEATGMSSKQMDSNAELKLWLSTATDPTIDIKANREALKKLDELYGLGGKESPPSPASGQPSLDDLLNKYK